MKYFKSVLLISVMFFITSLSFADDIRITEKSKLQEIQFNRHVLTMDRDSEVFLHSLKQIKNNNIIDVKNFMEYQLDEIVCASSEFIDKMNSNQKIKTLKLLHEIKRYREKNPRNINSEIDPTMFSKYYEPFNKTYAQRADDILAKLK